MSTFAATQNMRNQRHFEVLEIDLPVITGTCTIGSAQGTGTPLTCDQPWTNEYKTYYFTNTNAPILPSINGEPVYRLITNISETATEIMPGKGLSARASLSITLDDITGQDPNITAAGVTALVKSQGTYLGKLSARQIFENKNARLKLYRVEPDGSVDLTNGGQTRSFLTDTLSLNTNGTWSVKCKDLLSLVNLGEKSWPLTQGGYLRADINISQTTIPVDEFVDWSAVTVVRIGDEFLQVNSVTGNLTSSAVLNTPVRGSKLYAPTSGVLLTSTVSDEHNGGDEVFICHVSDDETIDSLLTKILVDSDFPVALIPAAEWATEVLTWHETDKINTIHSESESVTDAVNRILTGFLMDMWFSTTENKARLSAISVWKESSAILTEGKEINAGTIKKIPKESLRASRALVIYDKKNLSDSDDTENFKKASRFSDDTIIGAELYTKHKDKLFDNNHLLSADSANLLTQRYVSRFKFTPFERPFISDERYMTFKVGDVVDIDSTVDQDIYGLASGNIRAQITKINPRYKNGRTYDIKAMTYEAAFVSGSEIVLSGALNAVNLHILGGAPSSAVNLTFVLSNYSYGVTAIRAGSFATGSKITLILIDGFDGQASGGRGGKGQNIEYDPESGGIFTRGAGLGEAGGTVYDAQGVDTDIYFSGGTPSTAYPLANGYIRAPSGGAGGFNRTGSGLNSVSGNGGNGGDGRSAGFGGSSGDADGHNSLSTGTAGINGAIDGSNSGWGNVGATNSKVGGAAGSGVIANGAIINLFADSDLSNRYINGNGSQP